MCEKLFLRTELGVVCEVLKKDNEIVFNPSLCPLPVLPLAHFVQNGPHSILMETNIGRIVLLMALTVHAIETDESVCPDVIVPTSLVLCFAMSLSGVCRV